MIAIIDYGLGNVKAFANVYNELNIPALIAKHPKDLDTADRIILPGVGSFDNAMHLLEKSGMKEALSNMVLQSKMPVLGVCVGLQMLADASEEGTRPGLGWIPAKVKKFQPSSADVPIRVPHMGWNTIAPAGGTGLLEGLSEDSRFYFLHSFYFKPENEDQILARTDYGGSFACAVGSKNIYGVQFHPEKSHGAGRRLLASFARI